MTPFRWWREIRARLRASVRRRAEESELDEEFRFHLEMEAAHLAKEHGLAPEAARRRAALSFGGATRYKEEVRDAWGWGLLEEAWQDLRYAFRGLAARRGFALAATLTLALGIGANTAVFSAVNSLILHPLPYRHADRIVYIWVSDPQSGLGAAPPDPVVEAWSERPRLFDPIERYAFGALPLSAADADTAAPVRYIRPGYFAFLGEHPVLGRGFTPAELRADAADVVMLGYGEWKRRYGGRDVVGRTVQLGGKPRTIVGVAPAGADRLDRGGAAAYWLPLRGDTVYRRTHMAARLPAGMTKAHAESLLTATMQHVEGLPAFMDGWRARLLTPQDFVLGSLRTTLLVSSGAVALVLLIACANVASLLLGRAAARTREMAVRVALGAGRERLVRQLLTESLILGVVGSGLGILLAEWGLRVVTRLRPHALASLDQVAIDRRALLFTAAIGLLSTVLFGLVPAFRTSRVSPATEFKGSHGRAPAGRARGRVMLTAAEVALSVVLLVGAGLLIHTLVRLGRVNPGFNAAGLAAVQFALPKTRYPDSASRSAFVQTLEARAHRTPGIGAVTVSSTVPLRYGVFLAEWKAARRPMPPGFAGAPKIGAQVGPDYFATLGIPLLDGHAFRPGDRTGWNAGAIIVGRGLAQTIAPGGSAVGMRLGSGSGDWATVVGVVGDVAGTSIRRTNIDRLQIYYPFDAGSLSPAEPIWLVARARGDAGTAATTLQTVIRAIDTHVSITRVTTGPGLIHDALAAPRFYAAMLAGFAGLALVLASVGLFGVLAYRVQRRTREIGVRVALGAGSGQVQAEVVQQALIPVAIGLVAGVGLGAVAARTLAGLLYNVRPVDPPTLGGVAVVILFTALLASYFPARRAARVDPMEALREE